jgi:hypothetical protein
VRTTGCVTMVCAVRTAYVELVGAVIRGADCVSCARMRAWAPAERGVAGTGVGVVVGVAVVCFWMTMGEVWSLSWDCCCVGD